MVFEKISSQDLYAKFDLDICHVFIFKVQLLRIKRDDLERKISRIKVRDTNSIVDIFS